MKPNDVVIINTDVMTAYGEGIEPCWKGLLENRHAFTPIRRFDNDKFNHLMAATIPDELLKRYPGTISEQMLEYLAPTAVALPEDTSIFLASTLGEIECLENAEKRCTSDSLLEKAIHRFGKKHGGVVSAACASSNTAIARAADMIRKGRLKYAAIIGCDSVSEFVFSGFATLRAMATGIPRPYDKDRSGLALGDSTGIIVMTSAKEALRNNYDILTKVTGWGMTCDAVHITSPMESGAMLSRAVIRAVDMAGIHRNDIGAIIGHGTGTHHNDEMEINALNTVFPEHPKPLFSVKGACGHTLAGAGIIQTAIAVKMFRDGLIPPQTSLQTPESGAEGMLSKEVCKLETPYILTMNSGFGGLNAVLILENLK